MLLAKDVSVSEQTTVILNSTSVAKERIDRYWSVVWPYERARQERSVCLDALYELRQPSNFMGFRHSAAHVSENPLMLHGT